MTTPELALDIVRVPRRELIETISTTICAVNCVRGSCDEEEQSDGKTWCERNGECVYAEDTPPPPPSSELGNDQLYVPPMSSALDADRSDLSLT